MNDQATKELIETYVAMLRESVTDNQCFPTPAVFSGEALSFVSYSTDGDRIYADVCDRLRKFSIHEVLFGFDCFTRPGQGTSLPSAVIVFHLRAGEPPRIGVMEYVGNTTFPVDWNNTFWNQHYVALAARVTGMLRKPGEDSSEDLGMTGL